MKIDIQTIWNVFKHEKVEKEYIFYQEEGELRALKISKDETSQYGSLDLDYLFDNLDTLEQREILIVHNHLNDDPKPSFQDFYQYNYLSSLLSLLHVQVSDFLIVSPYGYFSFSENDLIKKRASYNIPGSPYVKIDGLSLKNHDFVMNNIEEIKKHLAIYNEVILSDKLQIASHSGFTGKDLFLVSRALEGENVVFFRATGSPGEYNRLRDMIEILKPIECYIFIENQFFPLNTGVSLKDISELSSI